MTRRVAIESQASPVTELAGAEAPEQACWYVRSAREEDVEGVAAAVAELLVELGAEPPDAHAMQASARSLIREGDAGAVFVAEADGAIVGVLGVSWQTAIHIPGRYALIQDLWVHSAWRGRAIGADLIAALCRLAAERGVARLEVGLPREGFEGLAATESFYRANGFTVLGARMTRVFV
jgi:GNAT superfamily N-acetyltransferase